MSTPEHDDSPAPSGLMVTSQLIISFGFDEEGDPAVWLDNANCNNIIEGLGMLEYAKAQLLTAHAQASSQ